MLTYGLLYQRILKVEFKLLSRVFYILKVEYPLHLRVSHGYLI